MKVLLLGVRSRGAGGAVSPPMLMNTVTLHTHKDKSHPPVTHGLMHTPLKDQLATGFMPFLDDSCLLKLMLLQLGMSS